MAMKVFVQGTETGDLAVALVTTNVVTVRISDSSANVAYCGLLLKLTYADGKPVPHVPTDTVTGELKAQLRWPGIYLWPPTLSVTEALSSGMSSPGNTGSANTVRVTLVRRRTRAVALFLAVLFAVELVVAIWVLSNFPELKNLVPILQAVLGSAFVAALASGTAQLLKGSIPTDFGFLDRPLIGLAAALAVGALLGCVAPRYLTALQNETAAPVSLGWASSESPTANRLPSACTLGPGEQRLVRSGDAAACETALLDDGRYVVVKSESRGLLPWLPAKAIRCSGDSWIAAREFLPADMAQSATRIPLNADCSRKSERNIVELDGAALSRRVRPSDVVRGAATYRFLAPPSRSLTSTSWFDGVLSKRIRLAVRRSEQSRPAPPVDVWIQGSGNFESATLHLSHEPLDAMLTPIPSEATWAKFSVRAYGTDHELGTLACQFPTRAETSTVELWQLPHSGDLSALDLAAPDGTASHWETQDTGAAWVCVVPPDHAPSQNGPGFSYEKARVHLGPHAVSNEHWALAAPIRLSKEWQILTGTTTVGRLNYSKLQAPDAAGEREMKLTRVSFGGISDFRYAQFSATCGTPSWMSLSYPSLAAPDHLWVADCPANAVPHGKLEFMARSLIPAKFIGPDNRFEVSERRIECYVKESVAGERSPAGNDCHSPEAPWLDANAGYWERRGCRRELIRVCP